MISIAYFAMMPYLVRVECPNGGVFFSIAAARDWEIRQCDAVTAFLNAPLDEEIYVKPPDGCQQEGQLWLLK